MRFKALFDWRYDDLFFERGMDVTIPNRLVHSLSVEELPYEKIPERLWPTVKNFRKLRLYNRFTAARTWYHVWGNTWPKRSV
jgi:hypothetical protein